MRRHRLLALCLLPVFSGLALAADPVLHCEVRYASQTWQFQATPSSSPYEVPAHDLAERFRFKAVVVGSATQVDYVSLYVYDLKAAGAPVLIHEARHKPPFEQGADIPALTGWNHVYSSVLGRELVYGCALTGARS